MLYVFLAYYAYAHLSTYVILTTSLFTSEPVTRYNTARALERARQRDSTRRERTESDHIVGAVRTNGHYLLPVTLRVVLASSLGSSHACTNIAQTLSTDFEGGVVIE